MTRVIAVFAKAPKPGRVKTRLQPHLTPAEAAEFYEASLKDVVQNLHEQDAEIQIVFDGSPGSAEFFTAHFPEINRFAQVQGDLGARLEAACERIFASGAESVLVLGADSPTLPQSFLAEAAAALADVDVVFGPTEDGGYYLVGITAARWPDARAIFHGIAWSTPEVLRQSLERAKAAGLTCRLVSSWYDVDEIQDLRRAVTEAAPGSHLARWRGRSGTGGRASPDHA